MPADAKVSSSVRYLPQPTCKKRLLNGDDIVCKGNLYATASKVGKKYFFAASDRKDIVRITVVLFESYRSTQAAT